MRLERHESRQPKPHPNPLLVLAAALSAIAALLHLACIYFGGPWYRAMGAGEEEARSGVRVSLGWSTTDDDVDRFLVALPEVVGLVRASAGEGPGVRRCRPCARAPDRPAWPSP